MLAKGKKKTVKIVKNMLEKVAGGEQALVGARYEASILAEDIPIATALDEVTIDSSPASLKATIYFRAVGEAQTNVLRAFRTMSERTGLGDFLDEETEVPVAQTRFATDLVGGDSIISNLQETPFRPFMLKPEVFVQQITIKGQRLTQITIEECTSNFGTALPDPITQRLVLLFMTKNYDAQTLLGYYADESLNRGEGLKLLQLLANGSLVQQVIATVGVHSPMISCTTYPMFADYTLHFVRDATDDVSMFFLRCDTATVMAFEDDIKAIRIESPNALKYKVIVETKSGQIEILFG